jgi:Cu/Ag efflux protein CusF
MIRAWGAVLLLLVAPLFAQSPEPERFGPNQGRVLEIDKNAGEITIRHGYPPELGMDPMSMIFAVADPALLDHVTKGERVRFKAGLVDGRFAVISITPVTPARKAR